MKLKHYLEDSEADVVHAIFDEPGHVVRHWHFQLVDTLRYYLPEETAPRPRIQYACFGEVAEYEIERAGFGIEPLRQLEPTGPLDPCFVELTAEDPAGGLHAMERLRERWDELTRNAHLAPDGDVAITLSIVLA